MSPLKLDFSKTHAMAMAAVIAGILLFFIFYSGTLECLQARVELCSDLRRVTALLLVTFHLCRVNCAICS